MGREGKSGYSVAAIMIVTFIIMMATLVYNPAKNGITYVQVYGVVTDENGAPLTNVIIDFQEGDIDRFQYPNPSYDQHSEVDDRGEYVAVLTSEHFSIPGMATAVAFAHADESGTSLRWNQKMNVTLTGDKAEVKLDFMLINCTSVYLPVGPLVLANTVNGSTQVEISTFLEEMNRCQAVTDNSRCGLGGGNFIYRQITDQSSLICPRIESIISGYYDEIEDGKCHTESYYIYSRNVGPSYHIVNDSLGKDYLNPSDVMSQSRFYDLSLGENITVSTSPTENVTLPEALWPHVDDKVLGPMTIECSYQDYWWNFNTGEYEPDVNTTASVTISPITSGTHHYQVYVEQEYIIHVWELEVT